MPTQENIMYDKASVIAKIGIERWEEFEWYMTGRRTEYDEAGLEMYHPQDVDNFLQSVG